MWGLEYLGEVLFGLDNDFRWHYCRYPVSFMHELEALTIFASLDLVALWHGINQDMMRLELLSNKHLNVTGCHRSFNDHCAPFEASRDYQMLTAYHEVVI